MLIKFFIFFTVGLEVGGQSVAKTCVETILDEQDIWRYFLSASTRAVDHLFDDYADISMVDLYKMGRDTVKSEYDSYQLAQEKTAQTTLNLEKLMNPFDNGAHYGGNFEPDLAAEQFRSACLQKNRAAIKSPKTARGLIEKVSLYLKMFLRTCY